MTLADAAPLVEKHYNADIIVYFGPVVRPWDDQVIDACRERTAKRKNVLLMLSTYGGDAHAAYRIARCLVQNYKPQIPTPPDGQVLIFVPSACASAGTLITLAADKLILSVHAELGPLDVQIRKPDEVGERTSGLTPIQALNFLEQETSKFFKAQFERLRFAPTLSFSTRMAADIAAQLANGLLSHQYEQIDPLRLAEYDRLMRIAEQYGQRIKTSNVKAHAIEQLIEGYPSHEFCIDPAEARELFHAVEEPSAELEFIATSLKPVAEKYINSNEVAFFYLTKSEGATDEKGNSEPERDPALTGNGHNEAKTNEPTGAAVRT